MHTEVGLRVFEQHGVVFTKTSGEHQHIGDCPFCNAKEHLYVNKENKNWDCKKCQRHGGFAKFLEEMGRLNSENISRSQLKSLAENRSLKSETLERHNIGFNEANGYYTYPVPNLEYGLSDLRLYKIGEKTKSCLGAKTNLFNIKALQSNKHCKEVFICEGEWDYFVMDEIIKHLKVPNTLVVGVPGAASFKSEWTPLFRGKNVHVLYDNDEAGKKGDARVYQSIAGICKSIFFTHWIGKPDKFDLRDLYIENKLDAQKTYDDLLKLFKKEPRSDEFDKLRQELSSEKKKLPKRERIEYLKIMEDYQKWLHLPNTDLIHVEYSTILANRLQGDPIWLFIVAPPGSTKSASLMSFSEAEGITTVTSLTPASLISGWSGAGVDPSLIPRLDGRVLVIKDFTTILTMPYQLKEEIFGILRDIYDGSIQKPFGNGVVRAYVSKFGMLCGVTPAIDTLSESHASLGERFLKYRYSYNDWYSAVKRAVVNIKKESVMSEALLDTAERVLSYEYTHDEIEVPPKHEETLIYLAQWTAVMRGSVSRDRFTGDIAYKPSQELGTRLAKQLTKFCIGSAMLRNSSKVSKDDIYYASHVARDTAPERNEEFFRKMYLKDCNRCWKTSELLAFTKLPSGTCNKVLQDLSMLGIVDRSKDGHEFAYRISEYLKELTIKSEIYL